MQTIYCRIIKVPVAVAAGGTIIPIKLLIHPRVFKIRNTGTMSTWSGMSRTLIITKKTNRRPKKRYLAKANPAIELPMTVRMLLVVATISEFIAYLGTFPVPKTAWKFARLRLRRSKFGGKVNKLLDGWKAEKIAHMTGVRKTRQTTSAEKS
jgi:hypothetical protein